jgi:type III restriction enzyme
MTISQKVIADILFESGRTEDFLNNPQKLIEIFVETLKNAQKSMEIEGIKYHRLAGEEYYLQEIFESDELIAYLDKNAIAAQNSVYDHIIYDSSTAPRPFAVALDNDPDVKMFFKIPDKFKIETPIGTYNPDWAVYVDKDGSEKLYFVIETKGTRDLTELHGSERAKIHCGEEHFKALGNGVFFPNKPVKEWGEVKVNV